MTEPNELIENLRCALVVSVIFALLRAHNPDLRRFRACCNCYDTSWPL